MVNSPPTILQKVAAVFPTDRLAGLCIVLMLIELGLHSNASATPFQAGGPIALLVIFWLAWFWLAVSWVIFFIGRSLSESGNRPWLHRIAISSCIAIMSSLVLLLHICSWGLFKQVGQFANLEAYRFLIVNPPLSIWRDLADAEKLALITACFVVVAFLLLNSRILRFLVSTRPDDDTSQERLQTQKGIFVLTTIFLLIPTCLIFWDESPTRLATRYQIVKTRMHPATTLSFSAIDQLFLEPIQPVLDEKSLTPLTATWSPPPAKSKRPSVIILAVEALRADTVHLRHQGREVLPTINRLASEGVEFTSAYSQSTHSDYADVCIVSSLYPLRTREHHYYSTADPWPKTLAFDVFKQAGYATAIISSQNEGWGNMDQFLDTPNLDLFYDAARSGIDTLSNLDTSETSRDPGFAHEIRMGALTAGKLEDRQTMDRALEWVNEKVAAEKPFFLSMNFQSSHFPYEVPDNAEQPFQPAELAADVSFMKYPDERTPNVKNAYYNGIHHCDQQIGRMIRELEKLKVLDDVILIVLGENGEALNENGYCGHAQEPVQPMIHVATVIRAPNYLEPKVETYPLEHIDIMPTVLGLLDWQPHPNFQGEDIFASDRVPADERLLFFHANNCSNKADAVILGGRWKLMKDQTLKQVTLYDLLNDPGEATNIIEQQPELANRLRSKVETWRENQLAYYHFFNYFSKYYPPPKPRWD